MQIVSIGDNLHEMSKPALSRTKKNEKKNMKNISVCHLKILSRMPKFFETWGKESMSPNI